MLIAAAQTKPEDAKSNIVGWLETTGIDEIPAFLDNSQTDSWVTAMGLLFLVVALAIASKKWWSCILVNQLNVAGNKKKRKSEEMEKDKPNVPAYNTIISKDPGQFANGFGNTIVDTSDSNGNTIIRGPASIGYKAGYDPTSTIIGAFAGENINNLQSRLVDKDDKDVEPDE